jgi:hypothetical protein
MATLSEADIAQIFNNIAGNLGTSFDKLDAASQAAARALVLSTKLTDNQSASIQKIITVEDSLRKAKDQELQMIQAATGFFSSLFGAIKNTIQGFVSVTSTIYNTTGAFTAVGVGLDAFFGQLKNVTNVITQLGGFLSTLKGWLGVGGLVISGFNEVAKAGLDVAQSLIKFNLEGLQKQFDLFVNLNKAGMTFGGSMTEMRSVIKGTELNLQAFGKVVQDNIENFAQLGIGMTRGAKAAVEQGITIGRNNSALLRMYGSFEALSTGAAEYMALQAQIGVTDIANQKDLTQNITNYLITQRQLTELTGQSAEALRRQEQERRKELAYQDQLRKLGPQAQENMRVALGTIGRMYGPLAEKYAKEFFSTGGQVISKEGIRFASMMGPAAESIGQILENIDQNAEDFQESTAKTINLNNRSVQAAVDTISQSGIAALAQAGYGSDIVAMVTTVGGHIRAANEAAEQITQIVQQVREQAARIRASGAPTGPGEDDAAARAIIRLNENLRTIDESIGKFAQKADKLTDAAFNMIQKFVSGKEDLDGIITGLADSNTSIRSLAGNFEKLAKDVARSYGFQFNEGGPQPPLANPNPGGSGDRLSKARLAQSIASLNRDIDQENQRLRDERDETNKDNIRQGINALVEERNRYITLLKEQPQSAEGGIATGPTTVGEAGPEAVIPLRQGGIPVKINFDPMLVVLTKQQKTLEDLVDQMRDSVTIQERLLRASA